MKKWISWTVVAFAISLFAMLGINWKQTREVQKGIQYSDVQVEKHRYADDMVISLERYRRKSVAFRKLSEAELAATKAKLKDDMRTGLDKLDAAATQPEEKQLIEKVRNDFGELLVVSAKLEPMLFSRDVYQKTQVQEIHDRIIESLMRLGELAEQQATTQRAELSSIWGQGMRGLALLAILSMFLVALTLYRYYRTYARPLRYLRKRAREISSGKLSNAQATPLPEDYAEIEGVMKDLAATVQMHRAEKHGFITAVAMELRPPLMSLQSSKNLVASLDVQSPEAQKSQARRLLESSLYRLSRALEDLTDIVDTDYSKMRLNESIVDVRDLLAQTSHALNGPGNRHEVSVSVPSVPIWVSVDPQRIERVIVNLVSKMMQLQPQGGRIQMIVSEPSAGVSGLEIVILEGDWAEKRATALAGPELDLLRHWVSQNGFGMSLAHKIMRAHGGSITAAGVAGTRVAFTVRLPKERVATGLLSSAWMESTGQSQNGGAGLGSDAGTGPSNIGLASAGLAGASTGLANTGPDATAGLASAPANLGASAVSNLTATTEEAPAQVTPKTTRAKGRGKSKASPPRDFQ